MNKNKKIIIFITLSFCITSQSFCMKRNRDVYENESLESENNLENQNNKKRKVEVCQFMQDVKIALNDFQNKFNQIKQNPSFAKLFNNLPKCYPNGKKIDYKKNEYFIDLKDIKNFDISTEVEEFNNFFEAVKFEEAKTLLNKIIENYENFYADLCYFSSSFNIYDYSKEFYSDNDKKFYSEILNSIPDSFLDVLKSYFFYIYKNETNIEKKRTILNQIYNSITNSCDGDNKRKRPGNFIFVLESPKLSKKEKTEIINYAFKNIKIKLFDTDMNWEILFDYNWEVISNFSDSMYHDKSLCEKEGEFNKNSTFYPALKKIAYNDPKKFQDILNMLIDNCEEIKTFDSWFIDLKTILCIAIASKDKESLNILKNEIKEYSKYTCVNDFYDFKGLFEQELESCLAKSCSIEIVNDSGQEKIFVKNEFIETNPLFLAILLNNFNAIKFLVEELNADVNQELKYYTVIQFNNINHLQKTSLSPIELALMNSNSELNNSNITKDFYEKTFKIPEYLISKNANINYFTANALTNNPQTLICLLFCNTNYNRKISHFLVEKGVDVNLKSKEGQSALDYMTDESFIPDILLLFKIIMRNDNKNKDGQFIIPKEISQSKSTKIKSLCAILKYFPEVSGYQYKEISKDSFYKIIETFKSEIEKIILEYSEKINYINHSRLDTDININSQKRKLLIEELHKSMSYDINSLAIIILNFFDTHKNNLFIIKDSDIACNILSTISILDALKNNSKTKNIPLDYDIIKSPIISFIKNILGILKENNININIKNDFGDFPITISCCSSIDTTIKDHTTGATLQDCLTTDLIENHNSNVNVLDYNNLSPLYYAVINGNKSSIEALIANKANLDNLDNNENDFYSLLEKSPAAKDKLLDKYFTKNKNLEQKFEKIINTSKNKIEVSCTKIFPEDRCIGCFDDFKDPFNNQNNMDIDNNTPENKDQSFVPRIFFVKCGHDICQNCLKSRFIDNGGKLTCSICKEQKEIIQKRNNGEQIKKIISAPLESDIEFDSIELRNKLKNLQENKKEKAEKKHD